MATIDGKYEVIRSLGEGLGGTVFLVRHEGREYALKRLAMKEGALTCAEILESFKREFEILKNLRHPNVVRIHDFGCDLRSKIYYFTTEYIEGADIFEATRESSPQEIEEFFVQALRALSYLHSRSVFHQDLKPANMLVTDDAEGRRTVKLIDFGLAGLPVTNILAGSPAYIAPEILVEGMGGRSGRMDLYSLGVVWYECLTRSNPFAAKTPEESFELQKLWSPPPVSSHSPKIPAYLDAVLERLLAKNPLDRYARAEQAIRDLNFGGGRRYSLETGVTALSYVPTEGRLVGRAEEWRTLTEAFDRVFVRRETPALVVAVSGPPGTGKTRLLREFRYHAQLRGVAPFLATAEATPASKGDIVFLHDGAGPRELESLRAWAGGRRGATLAVLTGEGLMDAAADVRIGLDNLGRPDVGMLASHVLGLDAPPEPFVEALYAHSEGNPLLLMDLLRAVIETRQIFDEGGRWSPERLKGLGVDFGRLKLSPAFDKHCRKKYDALTPVARKILAEVSVARAPLLRSDLESMNPGATPADWSRLEEEKCLAADPCSGRVRLLNPVFRTWVPQGIGLRELAQAHQTVGEFLSKSRPSEEAGWHHLGFGLGDKTERYRYLLKYGEALLDKARWAEASAAFDDATALAAGPEAKIDAALRKARALFLSGDHPGALKLLDRAQGLLEAARERPENAGWVQRTYRDLCGVYLGAGRPDMARECLQVSRALLQDATDEVERMILENYRAELLLREGRLDEAARICEETRGRWEAFDLEKKRRVGNNDLGAIYLAQGRAAEAKILYQSEAAFHQAMGDLTRRARAIFGWAESCRALGQYDEAARIYEHCAELSRTLKNEEMLLKAHSGLGDVSFCRGEWQGCVVNYQSALELAQRGEDLDDAADLAVRLAAALRRLHDAAAARLYLRYAIDTVEGGTSASPTRVRSLVRAYLELGHLWREEEDWMEARDAYRDALRLARFQEPLRPERLEASEALARVSLKLGRIREVQEIIADWERLELSDGERMSLARMRQILFEPEKEGLETRKGDGHGSQRDFAGGRH